MSSIFVFGSNLAGRHGKGSALAARQLHGAIYGQGIGRQGMSYGIPTKDHSIQTLPLTTIAGHVANFITYATEHPELHFNVVRLGCVLAGWRNEDIAPMFRNAPSNCTLDAAWVAIIANLHHD